MMAVTYWMPREVIESPTLEVLKEKEDRTTRDAVGIYKYYLAVI